MKHLSRGETVVELLVVVESRLVKLTEVTMAESPGGLEINSVLLYKFFLAHRKSVLQM